MKMNYRTYYWVLLITSVWISVTMIVLEGARPAKGTRWALLVAGSFGYENYRHQADVCHAYQILKRGGLRDENIIVFMYDDIANNVQNPRPGIIINKPNGPDVYHGVPKDYTGNQTSARNFFAVLDGNKSALFGGSGKVLKSGPNDIIFIYYVDHGSPGSVAMPYGDVYGKDLVDALKKKHAAKSYKKMVIYFEACEAGSMFEGILPNDINVYVTTASNATQNSYACYCPHDNSQDSEYTTCLGDYYSVSWMEDSDKKDLRKETLEQQYDIVRERTLTEGKSHVMQYGDIKINHDFLVTYLGFKHANVSDNDNYNLITTANAIVSQKDARLLHLLHKLEKTSNGSEEKLKAQKELNAEITHRQHVDSNIHLMGTLLFGEEKSSTMMVHIRPPGQPLVDDWNCFKTLIKTYETHCGTLSSYGRKYTRVFANMCNAGISEKQMVAASLRACA